MKWIIKTWLTWINLISSPDQEGSEGGDGPDRAADPGDAVGAHPQEAEPAGQAEDEDEQGGDSMDKILALVLAWKT